MPDVIFTITKRQGQLAEGRLTWPAKGLDSKAVSGPHGNGALPVGKYGMPRNKMLDKPAGSPYCDPDGKCWMQPADPVDPGNTRTELGIHPDGGVSGTEGCIGLIGSTKAWYDAFYTVPRGTATELEVRDA